MPITPELLSEIGNEILQRSQLGGRVPGRPPRRLVGRRTRGRFAGVRRRRTGLRRHEPRDRRVGAAGLERRAQADPGRRADPARHRCDARRRARRRHGDEDGHRRGAQADRRDERRVPPFRSRRRATRLPVRARELGPGAGVVDRDGGARRRAAARACAVERPADPHRRRDDRRSRRPRARRDHAVVRPSVAQLRRGRGALACGRRDRRDARRAHRCRPLLRARKSSCSPTSRRRPASCSTSPGCFAPPSWRSRRGAEPRRCSASTPRRARCSRRRSRFPRASSGSRGCASRSSPICA